MLYWQLCVTTLCVVEILYIQINFETYEGVVGMFSYYDA